MIKKLSKPSIGVSIFSNIHLVLRLLKHAIVVGGGQNKVVICNLLTTILQFGCIKRINTPKYIVVHIYLRYNKVNY